MRSKTIHLRIQDGFSGIHRIKVQFIYFDMPISTRSKIAIKTLFLLFRQFMFNQCRSRYLDFRFPHVALLFNPHFVRVSLVKFYIAHTPLFAVPSFFDFNEIDNLLERPRGIYFSVHLILRCIYIYTPRGRFSKTYQFRENQNLKMC